MAVPDARVAVFCGSSTGTHPDYLEAARRLGHGIAARGLALVYGGARVGLMGALADAALEAGGRVIGVIPGSLVEREIAHTGLDDLRVVSTMHERKALMASLADAFVALPGGMGTLDEMCEILTWAQLGLHAKPCGFVNVRGYWDPFFAFLDTAVSSGFLRASHRELVVCEPSPEAVLDRFVFASQAR
ncbi:MAG TPA: TIGR00730 family Rossman fold protein [Vicinamibacterales bacterium]